MTTSTPPKWATAISTPYKINHSMTTPMYAAGMLSHPNPSKMTIQHVLMDKVPPDKDKPIMDMRGETHSSVNKHQQNNGEAANGPMDIDPNKVTLEATSTPTFTHKATLANTFLNTHRLAGCAASNSTGNAYVDYLVSPFLRLRRVDYPSWDVNCLNAYRDIHSYGAHSTPC